MCVLERLAVKQDLQSSSLVYLAAIRNDYTAVCGYALEIHISTQAPGQVLQPVLSSVLRQYTNYTPASQLKTHLGMSMNCINDTDVTHTESGLSLQGKEGRCYFFTHINNKFTVQHLWCQNYSLPYGELFFVSRGYGILNDAVGKLLSTGQLQAQIHLENPTMTVWKFPTFYSQFQCYNLLPTGAKTDLLFQQ